MSDQQVSPSHARREPGGLENEVLATLAAAMAPLTPAAVRDRLGAHLAYTTVMTTLVRLYEKGLIARARVGRAYAYTLVDGPTICARKMRRVLDTADSRESVLARFCRRARPDRRADAAAPAQPPV